MIYKQYKKYRQSILYILILLILVLTSLPFASPVYADTQDRAIQGEGGETDGSYVGFPGDYNLLNTSDGDTGYLRFTSTGVHSYDMQNFVAAYQSISQVTLTISAYCSTALPPNASVCPYCRIAGSNYYGTFENKGQSYQDYTFTWYTSPATGLAWTATSLDAAEFGVYGFASGGASVRASYLKVTVTYTPIAVPTVTTSTTSNITYSGGRCWVDFNGEITSTGGADATIWGFAWGTTCNSTTPASTQPPNSTTYTANYSYYGTKGIYTFSYTSNLTCCTTFCGRAYARNTTGWGWGAEITFVTMCDPDIDTQAASYVQATTARLNSLVIYDGEQLCDVRFLYSTVSGNCTDDALGCTTATCNSTSYNGTTPWVNDTYATGNTPYVDLSGLTASKLYYFCVIIQNDISCRCGGQLTFTTSAAPTPADTSTPSNFKGIARATEISLFWDKGTGMSYTLIRGKTGSYPSSTSDGTEVYNDVQTSTVWGGLIPGTTYFLRAWGYSGVLWSSSNATLMITTLGTAPGATPLPPAATPTGFYTAPDYTRMSNMPFYGLVNWWAESFEIPYSTLWFIVAITVSIAAGIFTYWKAQKVFLSCIVVAVFMGFSSFAGLCPMWLIVPFIIVAFSSIALGERI